MSTSVPIRNKKCLDKMKMYYKTVKRNPRNYLLLVFGLNTALRISDMLEIKWGDVYNNRISMYYEHVIVTEQKTGKRNMIRLNGAVQEALDYYIEETRALPDQYLFLSGKGSNRPISRQQAFRIVKEAAEYAGLQESISCHSLRKTFGYFAWQQGVSPALIMKIYNHSSFRVTQRYLGIEQDEKDSVYMKMNL